MQGASITSKLESRERWPSRPVADIVPALARELLLAPDPPSRLPTVRELAVRHRASLLSIHTAMGRLREMGAIEVETRGPLGAFMMRRSIGGLWEAGEGGPLVIALPLASSSRYEALATAIKHGLTQTGLEFGGGGVTMLPAMTAQIARMHRQVPILP